VLISSADEDSSDSLSEPVAKKRDMSPGRLLIWRTGQRMLLYYMFLLSMWRKHTEMAEHLICIQLFTVKSMATV